MKVSVIIPAYNHDKFIGLSIKSVLEQSCSDLELIIINDGSSDKTEEEILKFNDRRIIYLSQANQGAHNTINKGIDNAKGEYISILNSDDIYYHDRLAICLKFLQDNKDYSVVITGIEGITNEGDPVKNKSTAHIQTWLDWYRDALNLYESRDFLTNAFAKNILITTSNYFMRKEVFEKVGKFRNLRYAHDWDMLLRLSQLCKIYLMKDVLLQYRFHEKNTVRESNSEAKVKFEVNWLIAENIRHLKKRIDIFELMDSIKKNHYVSLETLTLLLMHSDIFEPERLLDFSNPSTVRIMEHLK